MSGRTVERLAAGSPGGTTATHRSSDKGAGTPSCPRCGAETDQPYKGAHRSAGPARIIEVLELEGTVTASYLADRLRMRDDVTRRTLYRLRDRGLVVSVGGRWRLV